nr:integrase, catalytic region, zinc finger, CCHC-type, peptidase aspartic, catalytic [Tanacetum cinerariifolium]
MNYLEEQTDGEAMINSIKNGDQPLPRVTQVSIAGTTSTEQPPLKDKFMWSDQEKRIQKINHLWDALARHMLGSEYGEQDRKAAVLYEYETFKATEGELFLDTYIRYLQVINDFKKCSYSKDNCDLNFKFLNNLQPKWKQYATMMRQNKNLMDINIDALYNILKQNQGDVNDAMRSKKKTVVVTSDPLALIAEKMKTNFLEKFLGTVRFGNNDFAVFAGYGDVVIGSMMIKKVYYVEGLGHKLFSVRQFCDKGLEVAFRKSTCFVQNKDGVDLLTSDRSSNLYTIDLNEVASNSLTCLLAKASSSQFWLWHQCLSYLNFATINNLVKNNLVQGLPKMKF